MLQSLKPILTLLMILHFSLTIKKRRNFYVNVLKQLHRISDSDVGSLSNLGARHLEGTFSLKKGHFLKIKGALLCFLQNLGGTCPQCPPPRFLCL